jgi:hypothetical protein
MLHKQQQRILMYEACPVSKFRLAVNEKKDNILNISLFLQVYMLATQIETYVISGTSFCIPSSKKSAANVLTKCCTAVFTSSSLLNRSAAENLF